MTCLSLASIYDYLEKELAPEKVQTIEAHLQSCSRCRQAVEDRRRLLEACHSLPDLSLPPNWAQSVMAKLSRLTPPTLIWLLVFLTSSVLLLSSLGWLILSFQPGLAASRLPFIKLVTVGLARSLIFLGAKIILTLSTSLQALVFPSSFPQAGPGQNFPLFPLELFFSLLFLVGLGCFFWIFWRNRPLAVKKP